MTNRVNRMPQAPAYWGDDFNGDMSQDQPDLPAGKSPDAQDDGAKAQGGILSGWSPADWRPEDSGLHVLFRPEEVKDMDLDGANADAPPEPPPWQGEAGDEPNANAYRAIVPREPVLPEIQPGDIDPGLPSLGPDHSFHSAAAGVVTEAGWENPRNHNQGYGYRVRVRGDDGLLYTYGHTDPNAVQVRPGEHVAAGQGLGSYGDPTNGRSSGPHTHFEIRDPSQPLQPGYDTYIKNSRGLGAVLDPSQYIGTVMPGGQISSRYGIRDLNGKREYHPGIDINRAR